VVASIVFAVCAAIYVNRLITLDDLVALMGMPL
jgi:hypothetical protein